MDPQRTSSASRRAGPHLEFVPEKGTPAARRVRKARGLPQTAQPPGKPCETRTELLPHVSSPARKILSILGRRRHRARADQRRPQSPPTAARTPPRSMSAVKCKKNKKTKSKKGKKKKQLKCPKMSKPTSIA